MDSIPECKRVGFPCSSPAHYQDPPVGLWLETALHQLHSRNHLAEKRENRVSGKEQQSQAGAQEEVDNWEAVPWQTVSTLLTLKFSLGNLGRHKCRCQVLCQFLATNTGSVKVHWDRTQGCHNCPATVRSIHSKTRRHELGHRSTGRSTLQTLSGSLEGSWRGTVHNTPEAGTIRGWGSLWSGEWRSPVARR